MYLQQFAVHYINGKFSNCLRSRPTTVLALLRKEACLSIYPIFQSSLLSREVNITNNLCTKQGNLGLKPAVYNQKQVITACEW